MSARCEWCGEHGHDWSVHVEAWADVRAWEREDNRENERQVCASPYDQGLVG